MEMFGVAENVRVLIIKSMKNWNMKITAGDQRLRNVKIWQEIFQEVCHLLCFHWTFYSGSMIFYFTFSKNEDQLENPINTRRIVSGDIKMEFKLSKCAALIMKRRYMLRAEGIIRPKGNTVKSLEERTSSGNFQKKIKLNKSS